eukprot:scaffold22818_cov36-Phaeocystis_antarctica.AAC.1
MAAVMGRRSSHRRTLAAVGRRSRARRRSAAVGPHSIRRLRSATAGGRSIHRHRSAEVMGRRSGRRHRSVTVGGRSRRPKLRGRRPTVAGHPKVRRCPLSLVRKAYRWCRWWTGGTAALPTGRRPQARTGNGRASRSSTHTARPAAGARESRGAAPGGGCAHLTRPPQTG